MRWGQYLLCGWPGLANLWLRGSWSALAFAIGFSIVVNLALVSTFVWPALLGETFPIAVWPMILFVWSISVMISGRMVPAWSVPPVPSWELERDVRDEKKAEETTKDSADLDIHATHTLFNRAQTEYLKGHWTEAESLLRRRLATAERDVEARLMLATLLRRTRRMQPALEQLREMERFDESVHWEFEIRRERELLGD